MFLLVFFYFSSGCIHFASFWRWIKSDIFFCNLWNVLSLSMNNLFMICVFVKRFWYKKTKYAFSRLFNQSNVFWSMNGGATVFMFCFFLIKHWIVSFDQFKINTHWNHVRKIRWTSQNFSYFFLWYNLQRSIFFNFPCLNDVKFFQNPCFQIVVNIRDRQWTVLDPFCKHEKTLWTQIQICFVQSFFFLIRCVFGWNWFWSTLKYFTSQSGQSPSQSRSVINHVFCFHIVFDLLLLHDMLDGFRRGFVFDHRVNDLSSIPNRDDRVVLSRTRNVRDYVFVTRHSWIGENALQITIWKNFVCVVVIFPIPKKQTLFHRSIRHKWQLLNVIFRTIWIVGCKNLNELFVWFDRSRFLWFIKILINPIFSWIAWHQQHRFQSIFVVFSSSNPWTKNLICFVWYLNRFVDKSTRQFQWSQIVKIRIKWRIIFQIQQKNFGSIHECHGVWWLWIIWSCDLEILSFNKSKFIRQKFRQCFQWCHFQCFHFWTSQSPTRSREIQTHCRQPQTTGECFGSTRTAPDQQFQNGIFLICQNLSNLRLLWEQFYFIWHFNLFLI